MTSTAPKPTPDQAPRVSELGLRELLRWSWRQLTSMRTALILLLLLALAAIPGSVIPQSRVDSLGVSQWKLAHPDLTPWYERLQLFEVYDSVWFAAIYLLLVASLVGCIIPRLGVYWRGIRAQPPATPRNLGRLPLHRSYRTDDDVEVVLDRAREVLRERRHRLRTSDEGDATQGDSVSAERGYLREAGNLVFHLSLLIVMAGFALGSMFGYQGGVILVQGSTFGNTATQYDDFDGGSFFGSEDFDPFTFTVDDFDVDWNVTGRGQVMSQKFVADLSYAEGYGASEGEEQQYDLRVNHPLTIGDTDVFLIGHGYAPVVTVRDGNGDVVHGGAQVFLPEDTSFTSFGVITAPGAQPGQIGLEGLFFPTDVPDDGQPLSVYPDALNPLLSMTLYTGDLGLDDGLPQSVYILDKSNAEQVLKDDGQPYRLDIRPGETVTLPDGLGTVEFEGVEPWVRLQISQTPGKRIALGGVVLALIGLLASLFVRPRRVWVRARQEGDETMVEIAMLDRSGGADLSDVLDELVEALERADDTR